jgi:hypothetical protein
MQTAGYSGTPLAQKLGIKPGFRLRLYNPPADYFRLLGELPGNIKVVKEKTSRKNIIHYFTKEFKELQGDILSLKNEIEKDGMIWISWPKKASKQPTDITEDRIRDLALGNGLVDVKVCAVDDTWSGLKLVIPVKERK